MPASSNLLEDVDRDLFTYIHRDMKSDFLDSATPVIQRMGEPQVYLGVCALLCAFGNEKMSETGKLATAAFVESGLATYLLKQLVDRTRPLSDGDETDSFPSGHATFAFAMATIAGYEYPKLRVPLYLLAVGTAFSRVYLGRHYPGDVVAGAIIGVLTGMHIVRSKGYILRISF